MRKSKSKGIIALTIIAAMLLSLVVSRVSAEPDATTYTITIVADAGHTVEGNPNGNAFRDGEFIVDEEYYAGFKSGNNFVGTVTEVDGTVVIEIPNGTVVKPNYPSNNFSLYSGETLIGNETEISSNVTLTVKNAVQNNQGGDNNQIADNNQGAGNNQGGNNQIGGPNNIAIDAKFTDTHMMAFINGVIFMDDADGNLKDTFVGTVEEAGTTDPEETNVFYFNRVFGDAPVNEYTINGVVYKEGDENVDVDQDGGFSITVPGAEKYTIRGAADPNAAVPRTIIWTNPNYVPHDAEDEEWIQEFKLENGYGYIAAVYDEEGNLINPDEYRAEKWYTNENGAGVGEDGFGWVNVVPGSKVVFEFYPEYGYQLTDIRINGQKLGLSDLMNTFEFIMPNTNIHFDAEFTKTDDVLKDGSKSIEGGTIKLPSGSIENGTAQLRVNDVELSADKIKGFEAAAGDFSVKTYLDIDLYQVFYKGKDDSDDVWENKLDELEKEATITLKLADGLTADDIVIVHNIHDGEEYEVIEIDSYDEATNTITFKTKSFSNYAIATKGDGKKSDNPKTGDKLLIFSGMFLVAVVGLGIAVVKKNK